MTPEASFFICLMLLAGSLGLLDFWLYMQQRKTISMRVWGVNQWTLALAFAAGVLSGHFFTVP